jgi:pimeloyl-[acyl-carrier protein] methyl ester esterase
MSVMSLLLLHGWGFDAGLWDGLCDALPDFPAICWDRGYFDAPARPAIDPPFIAIGHSLGALVLAGHLPPETALVAINGFDRFTGDGAVPPRVVARMRASFRERPAAVLNDFRARCGAAPVAGRIYEDRLSADLGLLATHCAAPTRRRMLVLQGGNDPILPPALRASAYPDAARATHAAAGHLLPLTHAAWCAEQIRAFACA